MLIKSIYTLKIIFLCDGYKNHCIIILYVVHMWFDAVAGDMQLLNAQNEMI